MRHEVLFFMEQMCPICRVMRHNVLEKLEVTERKIKVIRVDVDSAKYTKYWHKWKRFCSQFGNDATPVVMMGPYVFIPWKKRDKPTSITDAVLSTMEQFEYSLKEKMKELEDYVHVDYRSSYEQDSMMSLSPYLEVYDDGVYNPRGGDYF